MSIRAVTPTRRGLDALFERTERGEGGAKLSMGGLAEPSNCGPVRDVATVTWSCVQKPVIKAKTVI